MMAKDSRTQQLRANFYSEISNDPNQQLMMRASSNTSKISQYHREYSTMPPADVVFPINNSSVMQNFRKNFVNELELTLPTRGSCITQKRISEYFPEVKNLEPQSSTQGARTKKRSLQELKMKYDSVQNMVANLSKEEFCSERSDENGTVTRAKRSRPSIQNENAIVPTPSKTQMVPMTQKSQAIVKKVKTEPETPYTPTFIHLVGHVDNILRWNHILRDSKILVVYNVLGYFISSMDGILTKEKFVYIRSNTGIILECSYFEIDRPLPKIRKDQFIGCFGHLIGAQRFRLFSIDVIDDIDSNEIRRLLCLSQRVTHELSNRKFN